MRRLQGQSAEPRLFSLSAVNPLFPHTIRPLSQFYCGRGLFYVPFLMLGNSAGLFLRLQGPYPSTVTVPSAATEMVIPSFT